MKNFKQYLAEQNELAQSDNKPLKGYAAETIIERLESLIKVVNTRIRFGVPGDIFGKSTTYRDLNGAIEKIKDIDHYYESSGEEVKFYCWSISYRGEPKIVETLKDKIREEGGFGQDTNMSLKKIIEYFSNNIEDGDNISSISISIDSNRSREEKLKKQTEQEIR